MTRWYDDLDFYDRLDLYAQVSQALEALRYGTAARLLHMPEDWTGTLEELTDAIVVRSCDLARSIGLIVDTGSG